MKDVVLTILTDTGLVAARSETGMSVQKKAVTVLLVA